jgi:hypothetical protein
VLVTSDHGHTPFVDRARKVPEAAIGHRYGEAPMAGAVRFDAGPLPRSPLYALAGYGAWSGTQHRGWHGGAGIEEVLVPLAFLTPAAPGEGRLEKPGWWWRRHDAATAPTRLPPPAPTLPVTQPSPRPAPPVAAPTASPSPDWAARVDDEATRRVLMHIDRHGAADHHDLLQMLGSDRLARRFAAMWEQHSANLPFRLRVETVGGLKRYVKES